VSLYCAERKILIAGDQILPVITTNVSTWHVEPEFDAVGAFLKTCKTFLDTLHPDTLILPSHRKPFRNVHHRLRQLAEHHAMRLNLMLDHIGEETSAGALIDVMFTPGLDGHQIGFAMGEAVAHLNHLVTLGHMKMIETPDAVRYRRIGPPDARVEPEFV
jgi:glyoxylase-like metal-dependent hydrolase (beta-lactamase superfamily II)